MFWLLRRRSQRRAGIESEADRLIEGMGLKAHAAARRMAREANDFWSMRYWSAVEKAIARRTDMRLSPQLETVFTFVRSGGAGCDPPARGEGFLPYFENGAAPSAPCLERLERRAARGGP